MCDPGSTYHRRGDGYPRRGITTGSRVLCGDGFSAARRGGRIRLCADVGRERPGGVPAGHHAACALSAVPRGRQRLRRSVRYGGPAGHHSHRASRHRGRRRRPGTPRGNLHDKSWPEARAKLRHRGDSGTDAPRAVPAPGPSTLDVPTLGPGAGGVVHGCSSQQDELSGFSARRVAELHRDLRQERCTGVVEENRQDGLGFRRVGGRPAGLGGPR